jgi:hypothetical protein
MRGDLAIDPFVCRRKQKVDHACRGRYNLRLHPFVRIEREFIGPACGDEVMRPDPDIIVLSGNQSVTFTYPFDAVQVPRGAIYLIPIFVVYLHVYIHERVEIRIDIVR